MKFFLSYCICKFDVAPVGNDIEQAVTTWGGFVYPQDSHVSPKQFCHSSPSLHKWIINDHINMMDVPLQSLGDAGSCWGGDDGKINDLCVQKTGI